MSEPPLDVLKHVVDVHCHPTDSEIPSNVIDELPITICAMATRPDDQSLVADLAKSHQDKVVPCFGFHPWFAHWISVAPGALPSKEQHYRSLFLKEDESGSTNDEHVQALEKMLPCLPEPMRLGDCISSIRQHFSAFPGAMLGEVGLDRSARVPLDYNSEQRELSPFSVPFEHQLAILEAQLAVAVDMNRTVSIHSVKAQKVTIDLLERMKNKYGESWTRISIDMHSCGFSPETWHAVEKSHPNAFLSLSTVINGRSPNHRKLIDVVSPDRLLVESDIHEIGQCAARTWDMVLTIADVKGWKVEEKWEDEVDESKWGVVRRLEHNFKLFMEGGHKPRIKGKKRN
ncbi:TatD DNase family Scn1 [Fomitiporia mediterranea MF3/22]|uniref:TatD DNase family Scn1 n=1 Tax=Fomitiporia mediterranea (strain MF3/22) TaxID=694068 RepID=UPI0004409175|nr:TatD DNase family Scn1 [Fomitiporia mediterranea MF3/22]EJD03792.1 TatD DNase family Scn1 [Fomitiporia mediterranea MF3/22]